MSDDDYIYDEATGEWRPASEVKQAAAAAAPVVRDAARLVTSVPGGHGAVREIASWILGKELTS